MSNRYRSSAIRRCDVVETFPFQKGQRCDLREQAYWPQNYPQAHRPSQSHQIQFYLYRYTSDVLRGIQMRFEKFRQKMIYIQQPTSSQLNLRIITAEQSSILQFFISRPKRFPNISIEFICEIAQIKRPG